jgi:hypothetical protein
MEQSVLDFQQGKLMVASCVLRDLSQTREDFDPVKKHLLDAFYATNRAIAAISEESPTKSHNTGMAAEAQICDNNICSYCENEASQRCCVCSSHDKFEGRKLRHA